MLSLDLQRLLLSTLLYSALSLCNTMCHKRAMHTHILGVIYLQDYTTSMTLRKRLFTCISEIPISCSQFTTNLQPYTAVRWMIDLDSLC